MKQCSTCKEQKTITEFNRNKARKDGLQTFCRLCHNAYSRKYYSSNREKHKRSVRNRSLIARLKSKQFLYDYLSTHPCVLCGFTEVAALQFDHEIGTKRGNLSTMANIGCSISTIEEEIEKCRVLCANCHAISTAAEFNWYASLNQAM